jgi:hypothetical protein
MFLVGATKLRIIKTCSNIIPRERVVAKMVSNTA